MPVYDDLVAQLREIGLLDSLTEMVGWDEHAMMPIGGAAIRADAAALLETVKHEKATAPELGTLIDACQMEEAAGRLDQRQKAVVHLAHREYCRRVCLPTSLVSEIAKTGAEAHHVWEIAKKAKDFGQFAPTLSKIVRLARAKADHLGFEGSLYNAMLNIYEPGSNVASLTPQFDQLAADLSALLRRIQASPRYGQEPKMIIAVELDRQERLNRELAIALGCDIKCARLDRSTHPFTVGLNPGDVRITTRYLASDLIYSFGSTMHETGHLLYEQGLPTEGFGTALARITSLALHESQSRFWENMVGRSRSFATWLTAFINAQLGCEVVASADDLHLALNVVRPSFIRTEADEVTYGLHICVRYEIERLLMEGKLNVADVPLAWNELMSRFLGVVPPNDELGCLQDVHWCGGDFGYFPTYALGNMYAAQFAETLRADLPGMDEAVAVGNFAPVLAWLRENIHRHGSVYSPLELIERASGTKFTPAAFLRYLEQKFGSIYQF